MAGVALPDQHWANSLFEEFEIRPIVGKNFRGAVQQRGKCDRQQKESVNQLHGRGEAPKQPESYPHIGAIVVQRKRYIESSISVDLLRRRFGPKTKTAGLFFRRETLDLSAIGVTPAETSSDGGGCHNDGKSPRHTRENANKTGTRVTYPRLLYHPQ